MVGSPRPVCHTGPHSELLWPAARQERQSTAVARPPMATGKSIVQPPGPSQTGLRSWFFLHLLSWQRQGLTSSSFFPFGSVFTNQRQELPLLLLSQPQNAVEPEHVPAHRQEWKEDRGRGSLQRVLLSVLLEQGVLSFLL